MGGGGRTVVHVLQNRSAKRQLHMCATVLQTFAVFLSLNQGKQKKTELI